MSKNTSKRKAVMTNKTAAAKDPAPAPAWALNQTPVTALHRELATAHDRIKGLVSLLSERNTDLAHALAQHDGMSEELGRLQELCTAARDQRDAALKDAKLWRESWERAMALRDVDSRRALQAESDARKYRAIARESGQVLELAGPVSQILDAMGTMAKRLRMKGHKVRRNPRRLRRVRVSTTHINEKAQPQC